MSARGLCGIQNETWSCLKVTSSFGGSARPASTAARPTDNSGYLYVYWARVPRDIHADLEVVARVPNIKGQI